MLIPMAASAAWQQGLWFVLIAVLWIGFFVLEGFDFGVAMLYPIIGGKSDAKRRVMVNAIGPTWDGNEVWLLTAGGATFAAFPGWYSTLFSALYLPLFLVLVGLIARGISFEYRSLHPETKWRFTFDWLNTIGSTIIALVLGVGFANFVRGMKVGSDMLIQGDFIQRFFGLFTPFTLLGGVLFVILFASHGAQFLAIKTKDEVGEAARKVADLAAPIAAVLLAAYVIWGTAAYATANPYTAGWGQIVRWIVAAISVIALVAAILMGRMKRPGIAFIASAASIAMMVAWVMVSIYGSLGFVSPDGTIPAALNMTTAASTQLTLTLMMIVAFIMVPIVLAYTAWAYWVFRKRLNTMNAPVHGTAGAGIHAGH